MRKLNLMFWGFIGVLLLSPSDSLGFSACSGDNIERTWDSCEGTETDSLGRQYVGEWKNGHRHGKGILSFPDGDKYVGEFGVGIWPNQGIYTFSDGREYRAVEKSCLASPNFLCVVSLALATSKAIVTNYEMASALSEISLAQAVTGNLNDASYLLSRAVMLANKQIKLDREIPSDWVSQADERAQALSKVAAVQTIMGDVSDGQKNFSLALSFAKLPTHSSTRISVLCQIAESQVTAGKIKEAIRTIDRAMKNVAPVMDAHTSHKQLSPDNLAEIASAQFSAGKLEAAKSTISKALEFATKIENDLPQWKKAGSENFISIALALAKSGNFKTAFAAARKSKSQNYRAQARNGVFEKMIFERARSKNIKDALLTALEIKYDRGYVGYLSAVQTLTRTAMLLTTKK